MPDWDRGQLRAELLSHGHQYLNQEPGRANGFIQRAVEQLNNEHDFPYRERTTTINSGDTVPDMGRVEQVLSPQGQPMAPSKLSSVNEDNPGVAPTVDEPSYYYQWQQTGISTYPNTDGQLQVIYYTSFNWQDVLGQDLFEAGSDGDKPIVPPAFRDLVLILARVFAKEDVDSEMAVQLRESYYERLDQMRSTLIHRQVDEPQKILVRGEHA